MWPSLSKEFIATVWKMYLKYDIATSVITIAAITNALY